MANKRSITALENPVTQTQRFGFPNRIVPPFKTPQNMAQTQRMNGQELSIFQHFTINNAYNDDVEENFVPDHAPIDITQEECSQITTDLKKYLENGQKVEHNLLQDKNRPLNAMSEEKNTSFYVEAQECDWQKLEIASPGSTYRTGGVYSHGYQTVYAQPKPVLIKANVENNEW